MVRLGQIATIAWPTVIALVAFSPRIGLAQDGGTPVLSPPTLEVAARLEVAWNAKAPEYVDIQIVVDSSGQVVVEKCPEDTWLCDRIIESMHETVFSPALKNGEPVSATVTFRFQIDRSPPPTEEGKDALIASPGSNTGDDFEATARVHQPGSRLLTSQELRDLPGAFGDPFRAIDALPGVVPVFTGLPYSFIRGAPPAGTLYSYDGIQMPLLFHFGLGPAVVHPRMLSDVRLHSSVPPARFGRLVGGVIEGLGPKQGVRGFAGEAELRLIDVAAYVEGPLGKRGGEFAASGRYGYPGLLVSLFAPSITLSYWDYQMRIRQPLSAYSNAEVVALGSFDSLTEKDPESPDTTTRVQFHRVEARYRLQKGIHDVGAALFGGFEQSAVQPDFTTSIARFGPRLRWSVLLVPELTLALGGDGVALLGGLKSDTTPGEGEEDFLDLASSPLFGEDQRLQSGAYIHLRWAAPASLTFDATLRGDVWWVGSRRETAPSPRLRIRYNGIENWEFGVATGWMAQNAVFIVPLPGLAELSIDDGLQRVFQNELSARTLLPAGFEVDVKGYLHFFKDIVPLEAFSQSFLQCEDMSGSEGPCGDISEEGVTRADEIAYGVELFIRRDPKETLSGWLSYTLGWAEGTLDTGIDFTPEAGLRHIVNLVTQWDLGKGFRLGARLHFRSQKTSIYYFSDELGDLQRFKLSVPAFWRIDALASYSWGTPWGSFRLSLNWLNATLARETVGILCDRNTRGIRCRTEVIGPITAPSLGLRASF